jgi:hypothetical protein
MKQEQGLVKSSMNLPGFVENAYESVDAMEKFSDLLLQSKLCPDHFYEKGGDNKPDYNKGKTAAVMMVLLQGHQLNLPPLTALQHIIPVNGLLSIKGDAAKSMIFGSGKLKKDSWDEEVTGSVEQGNYKVAITATRSDNGQTLTRSFSVADAKRAGLWIDASMLQKQDGWKYKKSAWYKYPERMINYRALGFLARDLFPDVMSGIYTTEEAMDLPQDQTIVIETTGGAEIAIPDKEFNESRSESLTRKAAEKIDKIQQRPMTPEESYPADVQPDPEPEEPVANEVCEVMLSGTPGEIIVYTEDELKEMSVEDLHDLIDSDDMMKKVRDIAPGKNTNAKLRNIILAKYEGEIVNLYAKYDPIPEDPLKNQEGKEIGPEDEVPGPAPEESVPEQAESVPDEPEDVPDEMIPDQDPQEGIEPNEAFDEDVNQGGGPVGNTFGLDIPELVDGKRSFDQVKLLFEETQNVAGLNNNRYETLITTKFPEFQKYKTKEDFLFSASVADINRLLNSL